MTYSIIIGVNNNLHYLSVGAHRLMCLKHNPLPETFEEIMHCAKMYASTDLRKQFLKNGNFKTKKAATAVSDNLRLFQILGTELSDNRYLPAAHWEIVENA